ncbi:MAG TPA: ferritin-like domain-containing protein, partial [Thermoleophilaceae bacterium]|nr:ferritin-like domain-containing protein [Thermoleophilaceae bacterium]
MEFLARGQSTEDATAQEPPRTLTRGQLLAGGTVAAGAITGAGILLGGLPTLAVSKPSKAQDRRVLEYLLQVEYIQSGFYGEAERRRALKGELAEFAERVGRQERAHVEALEKALGGNAPKKPSLDFKDATTDPDKFVSTAVELEEMALAAFNGQVPNLTPQPLLTAIEIASVEARHTGWIRDIAGRNPAPRPADVPATQDE